MHSRSDPSLPAVAHLVAVHSPVRFTEGTVQILLPAVFTDHTANAGRDLIGFPFFFGACFDRLRKLIRPFGFVRFPVIADADQEELIASAPDADLALPPDGTQDLTYGTDPEIAFRMSVIVIDELQAVHVHHRDKKGILRLSLGKHPAELAVHSAPVIGPRHLVTNGKHLQPLLGTYHFKRAVDVAQPVSVDIVEKITGSEFTLQNREAQKFSVKMKR